MVKLIHATHVRNLASILKRGLQARRATQRRMAVWFAAESEEQWAVLHVLQRKGARLDEVVILTVEVDPNSIRGYRHGLFYTPHDVPAAAIVAVKRFAATTEVLACV
jgi:hypothetical protein